MAPLRLHGVSARRLLELLARHGSVVRTATALGVADCTLRDQMRRLGIPTRPLGRMQAMSDDTLLRLLADCGGHLRRLRKRLHVTWRAMIAELDSRDLRVESKTLLADTDDATLVRALTNNGMRLGDAARLLGVGRRTLLEVMVRRGLMVSRGLGRFPLLKTPTGLVHCQKHKAIRENRLRAVTTETLRAAMVGGTLRSGANRFRVGHMTLAKELDRRGIPRRRLPGPVPRAVALA